MSLAATLAADGMRPASFLPAIKCSNCGQEIEIAHMGDHVCSGQSQQQYQPSHHSRHAKPTQPPPLSNPYTMSSWSANIQQYHPPSPTSQSPTTHRVAGTGFTPSPLAQDTTHPAALLPAQAQSTPQSSRPHPSALLPGHNEPSRAAKLPPPPRINPDAANKPFLAPSYPRPASPSSPVVSVRSTRSGSSNGSRPPLLRNLTNTPSPLTRNRSPSPDLASNLDCAFPSFPTTTSSANSRPGTSNGRKTPNSERAPSRAGSRAALRVDKDVPNLEPRSPRTTGGESVMSRANTLRSGPFDAGRRKSSRDEKTGVTPPRTPGIEAMPRRPSNFGERPDLHNYNRPRPAALDQRDGSPPPADFFEHRGRASRPPTSGSQSSEMPAPLRIGNRSNTISTTTESVQSHDASNEPAVRGRERTLPAAPSARPEFPPRSSSRSCTRADGRLLDDAPPVPKPVQHYRQLSKHTPSESASSASSASRSYSNANSSEGPSPVGSAASSIDAFSPLSQANIYDKDERPRSERMRSAGYSTRREQQNPGLRAETPVQRSPPAVYARPRLVDTSASYSGGGMQSMAALVDSSTDTRNGAQRYEPLRHDSGWASRDVPPRSHTVSPQKHNPYTQNESWTSSWNKPAPHHDEFDPYRASSPNPATRARSKSNASSIHPTDRRPSMPAPPMPTSSLLPPSLQRGNTSAKAPCRGCKQAIEGKSVKASDGRLTGRWHKHCFTCQTCRQPFVTADFYVIDDQPYCKQHYHEKNGSLCFGCKRGIEGQYLETSASGPDKKYHPHCFTCHECRLILSNDYFEINGQAYCERHAMAAMRGQAGFGGAGGYNNRGGYGTPSGLHPGRRELMAERRTTRLMMM